MKNKIVMIGSGKSAPFYLLTEKMTTVEGSLKEAFAPKAVLTTSADSAEPGCWRVSAENPVNGISDGILLCFSAFPFSNSTKVLVQLLFSSTGAGFTFRTCWYGTWKQWK